MQELHFANPLVKMKMFMIYTTSFYGSCLWNIFRGPIEKLYTSWNMFVRMAFDIPRETHRFFIEEISECSHPQVMLSKRFLKFHETLQKSKKLSVKFRSELCAGNMVTDYGMNLWNIEKKCEGAMASEGNLQKSFKYFPVPEEDDWKIRIVKELLEVKWNIGEIENIDVNNKEIDDLLKTLCCS